MHYDLDLVNQLCREIGLIVRLDTADRIEINLGRNAVLYFQNAEREDDCVIGFLGVPWHVHDNLIFADARGNYIELDYLNLLTGLKDGRVLIREREVKGRTEDLWVVHSDYNDEFKYLEEDERIIVRRATVSG
ncbi:hypothetical protein JJB99_25295 [Bradyrhizobium diazoefficiens]|uniref:hypothetical protein n=1 Tax=Bradyrhizobium diazoefficiens TaxID=1355477 RepID=UPI00190A7346|nr:hypothetical protein [Bradyrhizobium diazoefficiens]QQO12741.1 hypothetical protein JJB99_25295 [Bradyrhizobium diazoefficiens]